MLLSRAHVGAAMARVLIVGAGYVGLCTGVALATKGHDVVLADKNAARLAQLEAGHAPFYEPGLDEAMAREVRAGRLRTARDLHPEAAHADVVMLCVGTPQAPDGRADLTFVRSASEEIGAALQHSTRFVTVVVKSTVVPGTTRDVVGPILAKASNKQVGADIGLAMNPEFLKEGSALHDALHPDRIVVGATTERARDAVLALYDAFDCPKLATDPTTAETIKYAANAFLAAKVALSNELANVAARLGVDWYEVARGIGHDARIGPQFLRAGAGFGGSCFPKDVAALDALAKDHGAPSLLLDAILASNERQPLVVVDMLKEELGDLRGKKIALLGLAFKPDTDDVRETRALPILNALDAAGARVTCHDPKASGSFLTLAPHARIAATVEEALQDADGCILQTEWRAYRELDPAVFVKAMRTPIVVDGRRTYDAAKMLGAGVRYGGVGMGSPAGTARTR